MGDKSSAGKVEFIKNLLAAHSQVMVDAFVQALDKDYVEITTVKQIAIAYEAVSYNIDNENSYVNLTTIVDEQTKDARVRVDICLKHFPVNAAMENIIGILPDIIFKLDVY